MIIAKSNISFLVSIFNALKDLPVNQFPPPPPNAGNCILESDYKKFPWGACPLDPLKFVTPALNISACRTNGASPPAEPLHPALPNATENPDTPGS